MSVPRLAGRRSRTGIVPGMISVACAACAAAAAAPADLVLTGGTIYTLQGDQPSPVEAIAVTDGVVTAVGSSSHIARHIGNRTERIDLRGAFAVPGLVDAHAHLFNLGRIRDRVNLVGTTSAADCVERVQARAEELSGEWIRGRGWDQNDWDEPLYPHRSVLDRAFPDRPVYLRRVDGHAGWANSAALERAGFSRDTPDPEGGELLRDDRGELTGILIDAADELLRESIPRSSEEELRHLLRLALAEVAAAGLTGVHDMGLELDELATMRQAASEGWLSARVVAYLGGDEVLREYEGGPDPPDPAARLRVYGVKLYVDGALGSRGAALLEDYSDRPGHRGLLQVEPAVLEDGVARAMARGFPVALHAIGDRGNRIALDAIDAGYRRAALQTELPPLPAMHARVEHAQVVHPSDVPRFAALGIVPSMQPTHCTSDMPWAPERLGEERIQYAYAWRTLIDAGNTIPLGSDFPVEAVSPLLGLYAARTRQTPAGRPQGGWAPDQRLTALEALLGFTVWPAQAIGVEEGGRLTVGSRADVTVLDRDPLGADAAALLEASVLRTMVDGVVAYRSGE